MISITDIDGHPAVRFRLTFVPSSIGYGMSLEIPVEITAWLAENVPKGRYQIRHDLSHAIASFLDEEHRFAFKMRFG
jgi:hypothetical protein